MAIAIPGFEPIEDQAVSAGTLSIPGLEPIELDVDESYIPAGPAEARARKIAKELNIDVLPGGFLSMETKRIANAQGIDTIDEWENRQWRQTGLGGFDYAPAPVRGFGQGIANLGAHAVGAAARTGQVVGSAARWAGAPIGDAPEQLGRVADEAARDVGRIEEHQGKLDEEFGMPGASLIRQAMASATEYTAGGIIGGPAGAVAQAGLSSANDAFTEAKDRGLSTSQALKYAARAGAIEATIGTALNKIGLGGFESVFSKRILGKTLGGKALIAGASEYGEEFVTEGGNILNEQYSELYGKDTPGPTIGQALSRMNQAGMVGFVAGAGAGVARGAMMEEPPEDATLAAEVSKEVEKMAPVAQAAKVYEGPEPPTSRKGFEEATGMKGTSKEQREVFVDVVRQKKYRAAEETLREQISKTAMSPEEAAYLETVVDSHARGLGMSLGEYAMKWGLKFEKTTSDKAIETGSLDEVMPEGLDHEAYHGSPHPGFDRFSMEFIGTGENGARYGKGLYFAGEKAVAEHYRKTLTGGMGSNAANLNDQELSQYFTPGNVVPSYGGYDKVLEFFPADYASNKQWFVKVIESDKDGNVSEYARPRFHSTSPTNDNAKKMGLGKRLGSLYRVDLAPSQEEYLDWDKSFDQQSEFVKKALSPLGYSGKITGEQIYLDLAGPGEDAGEASKKLLELGIRGNRYLDQGSRDSGKGTSNYVIFDDADVKIEEVYDQKEKVRRAQIVFKNGETIIRAFENQNLASLLHELGHLFRRDTKPEYRETMERFAGVKDGKWTRRAEEKIARGFEAYMRTGKAPNTRLKAAFAAFKKWLRTIYKTVKGSPIDIEISPEVRAMFDSWFETQEQVDARPQQATAETMTDAFTGNRQAGPAQQADANASPETMRSHYIPNSGADREGRMPLDPVPGVKPIDAPTVMRAMRKLQGLLSGKLATSPVRYGRFEKGAYGIYSRKTNETRMHSANNVPTLIHEIAHAIEQWVFKVWPTGNNPWLIPPGETESPAGLNAQQVAELHQICADSFGNTYDQNPGLALSEGFAEYNRLYFTETSEAIRRAPEFTRWFEAFLAKDAKVAKQAQKVKDFAHRWYQQGAANRAKQSRVNTGSFKERIKSAIRSFRENRTKRDWVEEGDSLQHLSAFAKAMGVKLNNNTDPFEIFDALRGIAGERTNQFAFEGPVDVWGKRMKDKKTKKEIKPLKSAFEMVPMDRRDDFVDFLYAQRVLALHGSGREGGLIYRDSRHLVDTAPQEFRDAADVLYKWQDAVLEYYAQSSPAAAQLIKKIRDADPGFYIPLQRVFDDYDKKISSFKNTDNDSVFKKLHGSGLRIKDPLEQILLNTQKIIERAHHERMMYAVVSLAGHPNMSEYIVPVPRQKVVEYRTNLLGALSAINRGLRYNGYAPEFTAVIEELFADKSTGILDYQGLGMLSDLLGPEVLFMGFATTPTGADPILAYDANGNGEPTWYYVKPELLQFLKGDGGEHAAALGHFLNTQAGWFVRAAARTARAGTTGLRASFALVTNVLADHPTYLLQSQQTNYLKLYGNLLTELVLQPIESLSGGRIKTKASRLFDQMGLKVANLIYQDTYETRRVVSEIKYAGRLLNRSAVAKLIDYVVNNMQAFERAPRIAEMRNVIGMEGIDITKPLSQEDAVTLMLAAKQITTDHVAGGSVSKKYNQITPYVNASIQGPRAALRAFKRNPKQYGSRLAMLAALGILQWLRFHEEDWWDQASADQKLRYDHIKLNINGKDELVQIPRNRDAHMLVTGGVIALLDSISKQDPAFAKEYAASALLAMKPPMIPAAANAVIEQVADRDFFTGRSIVPRGMEQGALGGGRLPVDQYTEQTSEAAKVIAKLNNKLGLGLGFNSPARVDHWIESLFGPLASDAIGYTPLRSKALQSNDTLQNTPILWRLFRKGGTYGTYPRLVDKLYDKADQFVRESNSPSFQQSPQHEAQRAYFTRAAKQVSALLLLRRNTSDESTRRQLTKSAADIARQTFKATSVAP